MKVFIVFLGLFLIHVSFLSYQGDLGYYVRCQAFLKAVAEECAAGAALYYDEEAYAEGCFRFLTDEGRKHIDYILEESRKTMPFPPDSVISYEVIFRDDDLGYEGSQETGNDTETEGGERIPSVTVTITALTEDLFRLPFLEVQEIKRAAKYELPY